tara:strand:- start:1081 stop:1803 length:723 start_codon:yes stop_codon:yes gene_type:complete
LTLVGAQAALVELAQSEVLEVSEVGERRVVVADLELARVVAPRDRNNKVAAQKRTQYVPETDAKAKWSKLVLGPSTQPIEIISPRGGSPSQALPKPSPSKKEKEKENKINPIKSKKLVDLEREAVDLWRSRVAEPNRLPCPPLSPSGLVNNKSLRSKLQSFLRREPSRDLGAYFDRVAAMITDFHRGENDRGWVASLAWAIRPKTDAAAAAVDVQAGPSAADIEADLARLAASLNKGVEA